MMWSSTSLQFPTHFRFPKTLNPRKCQSRVLPKPIQLIQSRCSYRASDRFLSLRPRAGVSESRAAAETQVSTVPPPLISIGSDVIRAFYDGINRRDLDSVELLIGEECVYEDLVFSKPFVGRKAILEFFKKFSESISEELQFVIDDISKDDTSAVGVTWHLGNVRQTWHVEFWVMIYLACHGDLTFYGPVCFRNNINADHDYYGRDCVEPATKPGEMALVIIRGVTWILQHFPQLADRL